jgi:hypothetical protein
VANVGASEPSARETYFSMGRSTSDIGFLYLFRETDGSLNFRSNNDANVDASVLVLSTNVLSGIRLITVRRQGIILTLKDVSSGKKVASALPSNPITLNQIALGSLLRIFTNFYLNQPEYFAAFFQRATTDAEDRQMYRYIKRLLSKRGVTI